VVQTMRDGAGYPSAPEVSSISHAIAMTIAHLTQHDAAKCGTSRGSLRELSPPVKPVYAVRGVDV
jgi:hypothetical protein